MSHRCIFKDKLLYDDELQQFYRLVTAYWKDKKLDVAKIYEDGTTYCRNLVFSYLAGYLVYFPNEKMKFRYTNGSNIAIEEDFEKAYWSVNLWTSSSVFDKEYIITKDPSLKYLIAKYMGNSNDELLKLILMYRKYPEIEPLVEINQIKLALDKRLHKLTKSKRKEVINYVKNNAEQGVEFDLSKIFTCLKHNVAYKYANVFMYCKNDFDLFHYLVKQDKDFSFYNDYKRMAIKAGHNLEDDYWKYPKSLANAHDKVTEECKRIDNAMDLVLNEQFEIVAHALKKQEKVIDGNHYYIVQEVKDFINQAESLKQCLITAGYMDKFVKQESILIFIKDANDKPIGTVEIDYKKKILQAYGNEKDRNNCLLSDEIQKAVKQYISSLKVRKHKFTYKLPKNCYFKGLYDGDKSFNGMEFVEGKTYSTEYDDQTILKGDSNCIASDKVFHFCDSIQNVIEWVNHPSAYAIVEALGAVVKRGTAYGSNRIKIRKITTIEDIAKSLLSINKAVSECKS